jgi:phosphoadenosine phosphosulfate reductase
MEAVRLVESEHTLDELNRRLEGAEPEEIIGWAKERFGDGLVMSTSFGAQSAVMLHLVSRVAPEIPVIFIDTGYLFPETYRFADELVRRFGIRLEVFSPTMTAARQEALHGKLWEQGEEGVQRYLRINKVEPMGRALEQLGAQAWLAGLRADQTDHRGALRRVELQDGRYKIHPILHWSVADVESYMKEHELPFHPLYAQGYRSIGDWHSTLPTTDDMDPRDGRVLGKKRECGIHLPLTEEENASLKSSGL